MTFGSKLKEIRNEHNLTQLQLAEKLNLSKANISKYEANSIEPNLETLTMISKLFNVSLDYLIGNEQKKEPLSNREEQGKDLSKQLDEILLELELQADGLMFSGQALDDRTKEALIISLRNAMELAEAMNKKEKDK